MTACGGGTKGGTGAQGVTSSAHPEAAVEAAVSRLAGQSDVKMVLSLPITADQAKQLSAKGASKPMSDAEADALSHGSIFLNLATGGGEPLDSPQAQKDANYQLDLGLTIHGNTPLEVKYTGGNLYAQAELQQLLADVGQNPAKAAAFTKDLSSLDTYVPGISHLAKGDWVEVDHKGLQSLAPVLKQIEAASGVTADPSSLKSAIMSLRTQVVSALRADSTFKATGRDRYTMTVQVAPLLAAIQTAVANAGIPQIGAQVSKALGKLQAKLAPGQTAVVDLQTAGGTLSQAQIDLNQFAGKDRVNFPVPLQVAFSSPGAPEAPSGAYPLDVSKLPTLLGSLLGGKTAA